MIKNYNNEKITANQKAKELILDKLVDLGSLFVKIIFKI